MKKYYLYLLFMLVFSNNKMSFGQVASGIKDFMNRADTFQLKYLRDSLGIPQVKAVRYFVLREKFYTESDIIAREYNLTDEEKNKKFRILRAQQTSLIKELFTAPVYRNYIIWVNNQMVKRNMAGTPLSEDY